MTLEEWRIAHAERKLDVLVMFDDVLKFQTIFNEIKIEFLGHFWRHEFYQKYSLKMYIKQGKGVCSDSTSSF